MRRIAISELSTLRWSFYQDAVRYSSLGFESIGVWRQKIDDFDYAAAIDLLFELKLDVSSVHWAGAFTGCDGKSYAEAIEDAEDAIQLTRLLGADCLIVHPGSRNGHTHSHAKRLFYSALKTLVPIANDFEVKLAVEPMFSPCAKDWTIIQSLDALFELTEEFSSEHVGLVLDLYHVGTQAQLLNHLDKLIDYIALVQLADRTQSRSDNHPHQELRCALGTGNVPMTQWLARLQQLGYTGRFEVELHGAGMKNMDYFGLLDGVSDYLQSATMQPLLRVADDVVSHHQNRTSRNS